MQDGRDNHADDITAVFGADADHPVQIEDPIARQLMTRYLGRRQEDIKSLRNAIDGDDFDFVERTGHNLFGSGSAYGLDVVSALGACIEIAAKKREAARVSELVDELEKYLGHLKIT